MEIEVISEEITDPKRIKMEDKSNSSWNPFGSLRRSFREGGFFSKNGFFRIPATPRLVRRRNTDGQIVDVKCGSTNRKSDVNPRESSSIGVSAGWKYVDANNSDSDYAVPQGINIRGSSDAENEGPWFGSVCSMRRPRTQRPSLDTFIAMHKTPANLSPSARLSSNYLSNENEPNSTGTNFPALGRDLGSFSPVSPTPRFGISHSVEPSPTPRRKRWWRKDKELMTPQPMRKARAESEQPQSARLPRRSDNIIQSNRDKYFDTLNLSDDDTFDSQPPTPAEARVDLFNRLESLLSPVTSPAISRRYLPSSSETSRGGIGQASQESLMSLMSSAGTSSGFGQSPLSHRRSRLGLANNPRSISSAGSSFGDVPVVKYNNNNNNNMPRRNVGGRSSITCMNSSINVNSQPLPEKLSIRPLFDENTLTDGYSLDTPFMGREWVFRDIHETLIRQGVESNDWTPSHRAIVINGQSGVGKTTLMKYLALKASTILSPTSMDNNYPNIGNKGSVDSGIVGSRASLDMAISCHNSHLPNSARNRHDYLTAVSSRIVAYHFCRVEMAKACALPEFVCNLGAQLATCGKLMPYAEYLAGNKSVQDLLVVDNCLKHNIVHVFMKAICEPLKLMKPPEKGPFLILVDALDEAEYHRPENGDSIAAFLLKNTKLLPSWVKLITTVRSESTSIVEAIACRISLDDSMLDERVYRDAQLYVSYRISKCTQLRQSVCVNSGQHDAIDPVGRFADHITSVARGNLLYLRLTLDLLQQGHVRVKSASYSVLPMSLHEVFQLIFNLKFASQRAFDRIVPLLSIALASLHPLTANNLFNVLNAGRKGDKLQWEEFCDRIMRLGDLMVQNSDDTYVLFHPAFRDWLTHRHENHSAKFLADPKLGHVLLSLWMSRDARLKPDKMLEFGHHILKAHPFKHLKSNEECAPGRECQILWIQQSSQDISTALCSYRNIACPNTKVSRLLLISGASANCRLPDSINSCGESECAYLLCASAAAGQADLSSLLIEFHADVDASSSKDNRTALMFASQNGYLDIVQMLHQHGAKLCRVDSSKKCALVLAAENGHVTIVSFLLQCDWTIHREKASGITNIVDSKEHASQQAFVAAARHGKTKVCEFLLEMGDVLLESMDSESGETALCAACSHAQADTVQYLLKKGAVFGVNLPSTSSQIQNATSLNSILSRASSITNSNQNQLSYNEEVNEKTNPLLCAVEGGSWEIVSGLLSRGLNVDESTSPARVTALMAAAKHGHIGVMELLLSRGARVDVCDSGGRTALMWACEHNQPSCCSLLCDRGARIDLKDLKGNSAIVYAAHFASKHVIEILLERGAKLESMDASGCRVLDVAVTFDNMSALQAFLRKGAKLASSTWALAKTRPKVAIVLLQKLFEDGSLLYRRGRVKDSCARFTYAVKKFPCELNSNENCVEVGTSVDSPQSNFVLDPEIRESALLLKYKILLGLARCQRRLGDLQTATDICTQAALYSQLHSNNSNTGFEAYFLRAKCYFDNKEMLLARRDAEESCRLCPNSREAHDLLQSLTLARDSNSRTGNVDSRECSNLHAPPARLILNEGDEDVSCRNLKSNSPADCSSDSGNQADLDDRRQTLL